MYTEAQAEAMIEKAKRAVEEAQKRDDRKAEEEEGYDPYEDHTTVATYMAEQDLSKAERYMADGSYDKALEAAKNAAEKAK